MSQPLLDKILALLISENASKYGINESGTLLPLLRKLDSETSKSITYDKDKLLLLAEGLEYFKIADYLYLIKKNYAKIIQVRLLDKDYKKNIFGFIRSLMESTTLTDREKAIVKNTTLAHIQDLINIDSVQTSTLVIQCFNEQHATVLKALDSYPQVQYNYLKSIVDNKDKSNSTSTNTNDSSSSSMYVSNDSVTSDVLVLYIKLLARYNPENVHFYLVSHDNYPLDSCLKICQDAKLTDATIYLLERTGDVSGALNLQLKELESFIYQALAYYKKHPNYVLIESAFHTIEEEKQIAKLIDASISLCQRNSQKLQDTENEMLWFLLIDALVLPLRKLRHDPKDSSIIDTSAPSTNLHTCLNYFLKKILYHMLGYVALPAILSKIVNDHGTEEWADFKLVILGMLDTYTYEKSILQIANHLINQDLFNTTRDLYKKRSKALRTKVSLCNACQTRVAIHEQSNSKTAASTFLVFFCGHVYHKSCLTEKSTSQTYCPQCSSIKKKEVTLCS